jgi:predicted nucleic acid-binding protein
MRALIFRIWTMIIDASVAVPWLIDTPFSKSARTFKDRQGKAPTLLLVETANSLLKYERAGQLHSRDRLLAMKALPIALVELVTDAALLAAAIDIALARNHKVYDCLYLALAIERNEPLATADLRLATLAKAFDVETHLIEPS